MAVSKKKKKNNSVLSNTARAAQFSFSIGPVGTNEIFKSQT